MDNDSKCEKAVTIYILSLSLKCLNEIIHTKGHSCDYNDFMKSFSWEIYKKYNLKTQFGQQQNTAYVCKFCCRDEFIC